MLQGIIYTLAALLVLGGVIAALTYGQGPFGVIWAIQLAGLAAVLAFLALCAFAPDQPVKLKSSSR
ncbi:MAG: hypothetical protein KatS3mg060_3743 [Dehalococcoidia bacterium]|jgi:hypothetical protein|nr:MAG: hypothetical protein KatS3mg060_3743 [Dehalococcoidia bacterium]